MIDRVTRVLAGLLGRSAGMLAAARREWAEALLAEAGEVPAGSARVAWLGGGLWLVAREAVMGRAIRVLAFAAGAVGLAWVGWPGASSDSATPLNRVSVTVTVVLLAVLPWVAFAVTSGRCAAAGRRGRRGWAVTRWCSR